MGSFTEHIEKLRDEADIQDEFASRCGDGTTQARNMTSALRNRMHADYLAANNWPDAVELAKWLVGKWEGEEFGYANLDGVPALELAEQIVRDPKAFLVPIKAYSEWKGDGTRLFGLDPLGRDSATPLIAEAVAESEE